MEKKLKLLVEQVELTRDEVDSLEETLEGLAEVIGSKFPGSKLLPYGSAASGLAIHGSDLDLFVRLGPGQQGGGPAGGQPAEEGRLAAIHGGPGHHGQHAHSQGH